MKSAPTVGVINTSFWDQKFCVICFTSAVLYIARYASAAVYLLLALITLLTIGWQASGFLSINLPTETSRSARYGPKKSKSFND